MEPVTSWTAASLRDALRDDLSPVKILLIDDQTFDGNEPWFKTPKGEYLEMCAMTSDAIDGHVLIVRKVIGDKE